MPGSNSSSDGGTSDSRDTKFNALSIGESTSDEKSAKSHDSQIRRNIAAHLERLTMISFDLVNNGDLDFQTPEGKEFRSHVSPLARAHHDDMPNPVDWEEFATHLKKQIIMLPKTFLRIDEMWTEISRSGMTAETHTQCSILYSDDIKIKGFGVLEWKLRYAKLSATYIDWLRWVDFHKTDSVILV